MANKKISELNQASTPLANTDEFAVSQGTETNRVSVQNLKDAVLPDNNTTGSGTSTDNAVARWDGTTGDKIQNSGVVIDDNDNIHFANVGSGETQSINLDVAGKATRIDMSAGEIDIIGDDQGSAGGVVKLVTPNGVVSLNQTSSNPRFQINLSGKEFLQAINAQGQALYLGDVNDVLGLINVALAQGVVINKAISIMPNNASFMVHPTASKEEVISVNKNTGTIALGLGAGIMSSYANTAAISIGQNDSGNTKVHIQFHPTTTNLKSKTDSDVNDGSFWYRPDQGLLMRHAGKTYQLTPNSGEYWSIDASQNIYRTIANVGIGTETPTAKLHVNGSLKFEGNGEAAGKVLTSDANGVATWQSSTGGGFLNVLWVDASTGNDTTGNGKVNSPYATIRKAMELCAANGFIYVMPGTYAETLTSYSDVTIADNITIFAYPGAIITGPARSNTAYGTTFNGDKRFIYHVSQAKTLNIKGSFDVKGYWGLFSCDHASAVVNCEVNTYKLDGVTGSMNIRVRAGYTNMIVKSGDMILQDQQGIFVGPQGGALDLNVLTGKIIMKKTNTGWVSNQTRMFQIRSASTTRPINITCNGIESEVHGDHFFNEFIDTFYMESPSSVVNVHLRGGALKENNIPNDGDFRKITGQNGGVIFNGGGTLNFHGDIETKYTQGVQVLTSSLHAANFHGRISTTNASAVDDQGTNSSSQFYFKDKVKSSGLLPTVSNLGTSQLFFEDGIVNDNASTGTTAILNNGSGLILKAGAGIISNGKSITTEVSGRTYKLYADTHYTTALAVSPESKVMKVNINKVRNSQTYSVTINGTAYTFISSASATAVNIAAGLVAAIGTPSGVSSVVDNTDGTFTVTAVAGTNLTVIDSTTWSTDFKWQISRSVVDGSWSITINGTSFSFTSSDTSYYHETGGGISNIRDAVKALIQANGTINVLIGTYQVDTFGLTLIATSTAVFDTISAGGNTNGKTTDPQKPLLVSTVNAGYLGGMTNLINGTEFVLNTGLTL